MGENIFKKTAHTEHMLFECVVSGASAPDVRLFRPPTVHDGNSTQAGHLNEVSWKDLNKDDIVVALVIEGIDESTRVISILQIWHVLEISNGEARVLVNHFVGSGANLEFVYDRLAGLVGLLPSTGGSNG
jgi:hypothetical protein